MPVTRESLLNNSELNTKIIGIMKEIISTNDKALIANLLDFSKKVIIDLNSLYEIINIAANVNKNINIEIIENDETKKCCGKIKIRVYNSINSILIDGEELNKKEPEVYKYITNDLNISLTRTYVKNINDMVIIEND